MDEKVKDIVHKGIDGLGGAIINLLPVNGYLRNALEFGLDKGTDLIFDDKKGENVPLSEHSELKDLASYLVPVVLKLVDAQVLKPLDLPFYEVENELTFEKGILLQLEATLTQTIQNVFKDKAQA